MFEFFPPPTTAPKMDVHADWPRPAPPLSRLHNDQIASVEAHASARRVQIASYNGARVLIGFEDWVRINRARHEQSKGLPADVALTFGWLGEDWRMFLASLERARAGHDLPLSGRLLDAAPIRAPIRMPNPPARTSRSLRVTVIVSHDHHHGQDIVEVEEPIDAEFVFRLARAYDMARQALERGLARKENP